MFFYFPQYLLTEAREETTIISMGVAKRTTKKTVIGLVYLGILALIIIPFIPEPGPGPSCFDGMRNGKEEGVDCGGSCQACVQTLDLQVIDSGFVVSGRTVDAMARITNPNSGFGLSDFSYDFNFYDSGGAKIYSSKNRSFILPNESKYLVMQALPVRSTPVTMQVEIGQSNWESLPGIPRVELLLPNPEVRAEGIPFFAQLTGVVINDSDLYFDEIKIAGVLRDFSGRIVGIRETQARGLDARERREYNMSWSEPLISTVEVIDVEAYSNLFLNENYINRSTQSERFQQF